MIYTKPQIQKPYILDNKGIGEYLKELKQAKKKIEKYDWTFEKARLCGSEWTKEVLGEIDKQIKFCEHYFITKKRKDLFKWIVKENYKPGYSGIRDVYTFSNGKIKGIINIFKREKSTEIVYKFENDCKLYLFFKGDETHRTLRSEESIKKYLEEIKVYLEKEVNEVDYNEQEQKFYDFILNCGEKNG